MRPKPYFAPRFAPALPWDDRSVRALPVPGYRQVRNYTCGYACALMVARYFREDIGGRALFSALGTDRSGTRQTALVRALRERGVSVSLRYDLTFSRLRDFIEAGKLAIGYRHSIEHWVVIYGYGVGPERVFLADPRADTPCEHAWGAVADDLDGFAMVCSDRDARRPPAEPGEAGEPGEPEDAEPCEPDGAMQLSFDLGAESG